MKKNILLLLICLPFFSLLLQGCVETVTDPPDRLAPRIDVWSPATDDTIKNGRNYISYYAEDDRGINYCEVYVNGILNKKFEADSAHNLQGRLYFWLDETLINSRIEYVVIVYDLWGNTSSSSRMTNLLVAEDESPPETPENFTIKQVSSNILKLSWTDASDNESGFEIWRKDWNNSYELFKVLDKNSVTAYDSSLINDRIYYYKICAFNKYGKSAFSSEVNSRGIGELNAPANLTGTALGTNQIKLTWQDKSTHETRFKIERKNSDAFDFSHLAYVDSNVTEYTDRYNMYAGGSYSYRVAAVRDTGRSDWSNQIDVVTLSENVSAPTNLSAQLLSSRRSVLLKWNDYNYTSVEAKIERKTLNGIFTEIASVPAGPKSFEDFQVNTGNYYSYRVRIITEQGNYSLYSNEVSIAFPVIPPNAPGELKLFKYSETLFNLQWKDNSDDEEGFQLWRSDGTTNNFKIIRQLIPNAKSDNDSVTNGGIIYYYKIRAYRDTVLSDFSNIVNSSGGSGLYPLPGDFKAIALCPSQVKLTWKDNTNNELGFRIERKTSWTTFSEIALLPPGSGSFIDKEGLIPGIEYIYRINVFSSTQESDWSEEKHVIMPSTGECGG